MFYDCIFAGKFCLNYDTVEHVESEQTQLLLTTPWAELFLAAVDDLLASSYGLVSDKVRGS